MVATYAALLRGINVGGHSVRNDRLRELFEDLGFEDVRAFLASGNLIFECAETDCSALERRIELAALAKEPDRVAFRGRELYWWVTGRFMDSALSGPGVGQLLGEGWTVRRAKTVQRLTAKLAG